MSETTKTRLTDSVADEVRALLARRRISAAKLAQDLGWSQPYMARRMTGAQPFDLNDLQKIATLLEVKVSDIIAHAERGDGAYGDVGVPDITIPTVRVTGTTAHPAHPIVTAAVPLPRRGSTRPHDRRPANRPDTLERRTAPTGR